MNTRLMTSLPDLQSYLRDLRGRGRSLGLVATQGALHEGHQSLIRRAKQQCDAVVVSLFAIPAQFDPADDRGGLAPDVEKDAAVLRSLNVDVGFAPAAEEIYPAGFQTYVEPGSLALPLEGASRPGHFRGVTTLLLKLFNQVHPDVAYFGQKDFQQVQVIRRLVEDLNLTVRLVICPTVRDSEGLALGARNALLGQEGRAAAAVLHRTLRRAETLVHQGEVNTPCLLEAMRKVMEEEPGAALDYLAIVNPLDFEPVERVSAGTVALIAARLGAVRLIDNLIFGPPGASAELLLQLAFAARPVIDSGARIPGLETEALVRRIDACRDCAAFSSVMIPPREYLAKYLKRDYPDLNRVRVLVIGRDAPMDPAMFLYRQADRSHRFAAELYALVGVGDYAGFKHAFALTDALRCHVQSAHLPERALAYCARHLREELKQFPQLQAVVTLGEDAYRQFQKDVLERPPTTIRPFEDLLKAQGWASEDVRVPFLKTPALRAIYCYHPTTGYKRSPSIAAELPPLAP